MNCPDIQEIKKQMGQMTNKVFWYEDGSDPNDPEFFQPIPDIQDYEDEQSELCKQLEGKYSKSQSDFDWAMASCYIKPLLKKNQEFHLFRQLNAYKLLIIQFGKQEDWPTVHRYIQEARRVQHWLVVANLRLPVRRVKKLYFLENNWCDILQETFILICHAVNCFNWTLGNKFSTYGEHALRRTMSHIIEQVVPNKHNVSSLDEQAHRLWLNPLDENVLRHKLQDELLLKKALSFINNPRDRIIFCETMASDPRSMEEIGGDHGVTKERIRQIKVRTTKIIREQVELGRL